MQANQSQPNASAAKTAQMTDADILVRHSMGCRHRAMIELTIVHRLMSDLLKAGLSVYVNDGEEITRSTSEQELVNSVFAVDEATVHATDGDQRYWVVLVLGNDGHDVISDYTINASGIMDPINAWIDSQVDAGKF